MSGIPCKIIIEGNRLQAYARTFAEVSNFVPVAEQTIAAAQSVCQLGTFSYDGKEVMTDEQQARAPVIMAVANNELAKIDFANWGCLPHDTGLRVAGILSAACNGLNQLLADVLANP